jgi:hypothetical protein
VTSHSSVRSGSAPGLAYVQMVSTGVRPGGCYDTGAVPKPGADGSDADAVATGR